MSSRTLFFLTFARCCVGKQYVAAAIHYFCKAYLVAEEHHEDSELHLHVFLETLDEWDFESLKEELAVNEELSSFVPNVQAVRNRRDVCRYITKEDKEPIHYNIPLSHMSFYYQCCRYATHHTYSPDHPFVVGHHNRYRFIEQFCRSFPKPVRYTL